MVFRTSDAFPLEGPGRDLKPPSGLVRRPIDLELEDAPIREAMAHLAEATEYHIAVHEAVPEDIRITARLYRVGGYWLLNALADQAGLTVMQEPVKEVTDEEGRVTVYNPQLDESPPIRPGVTEKGYSIFHVGSRGRRELQDHAIPILPAVRAAHHHAELAVLSPLWDEATVRRGAWRAKRVTWAFLSSP
jgi:hypothetical protein